VLGRFERGLARERLPHEEQRGETAERREEPQRLRLDVDRALELRLDGSLRVELDLLSVRDPLDPGSERVQVRVPALQPDPRELEPHAHAAAVGLVERRRHRDVHQPVL
jgi:hypothetical protein